MLVGHPQAVVFDERRIEALAVRHAGVEQSNSSVIFGEALMLKALKLARPFNPEKMTNVLTGPREDDGTLSGVVDTNPQGTLL